MNEELKAIYDADQEDRQNWTEQKFKEDIQAKDRERRTHVTTMIEDGGLVEGADYYYAAMVFQHGEIPEDYLTAKELAIKASELGERRGLWLTAAATDRYLTSTKQPFQKYGTQYRKDNPEGKWYLYPVDPETTDEERAIFNVPTMEEILKREKEMNKA